MKLILEMLIVKFLFVFLLGLAVAVMNTDWSTDQLLFVDPFLTKVAAVLSIVGIFGTFGCAIAYTKNT